MNNKYQIWLALFIIVSALYGYFTAESPFTLVGGFKIHPSNCQCFTCKPQTQYKGNLFNTIRKQPEDSKPSRNESSSSYSPPPNNSTYNNPYRNSSQDVDYNRYNQYNYEVASVQTERVKDRCGACNGTGKCTVCGGLGMTYNNMTEKYSRCDVCRQSGDCVACYGRGY